jgi:hypothetical protein
MMELAEELNELIREENKIKAINESIVENFYENTATSLVCCGQTMSEDKRNWSLSCRVMCLK